MKIFFKHCLYITGIFFISLIFSINTISAQGYVLDEFDLEIKEHAQSCSQEITFLFETYLNSGALTPAQVFDTFYIPIPDTEPPKYSTQYDTIVEKSLQAILDKYLGKNKRIVYIMAVDAYGYLPAQNSKYSYSHTGNQEDNLKNNKAKRILNDRIGLSASRNKTEHLVQPYQWDNGEKIKDFSIPLVIKNRHWGAVRIGYNY